MNFDFLKDIDDFKKLYSYCHQAELAVYTAPSLSVVASRNALESLVKSFYIIKYGNYPENESLYDLITDGCFSSYLDDALLSSVHFVRKIGNDGAHGEEVPKKSAINVLRALQDVIKGLFCFLKVDIGRPIFDKKIYDEPNNNNPILAYSVVPGSEPEKPEEIEKYKNGINASVKAKSSLDFTEAETRKTYIDIALNDAGWKVCETEGAIKAGMACVEIKLQGMPNAEGVGYADYVLFDDDGKPIAVIEAKKTSKDEIVGSQQAKLYADCIEKIYGVRPVIFYTNGYIIKMVDCAGYPPRRVYGFYTKDELHSLIVRRTLGNITNTRIDPSISDRYFIQNACTAVCESFNQKRRKALVVMATGTGKTRCSISIVDVLQKCNWVKHVLFLADRTALINQAKNAFSKHLPDSSICVLSNEKEESRDYNARIMFSTYQTMINLIDCEEKKFGVAKFDLIIVDECHRSVYNKYGAIFNYFDSLLIGLTATPREQVDSSTYELFNLPKGEPTFSYDYETAVKEGFLVDFHAFERTTKLLKSGLRYDELTKEEQEQYENLFADKDGNLPKQIDGEEFRKRIMNIDTIDNVLQTLMNEGMRVNGGEKLGKTIIFAANHFHAEKIVDRFNTLYPELGGKGFCKLIDNYVNYAQTLIDDFSKKDVEPTIAVSVDMLDTGIDVPEVVNLVFFKRVFSKIKFWQMIGRGTRTCKELNVYSPSKEYFEKNDDSSPVISHQDKQGFYIFDFCDVFEFFRKNPDGREAKTALNLSQKIFELKLDMIFELQKAEHQGNAEHKAFYEKYKEECFNKVKKLNRSLINVKTSLKFVDKYSDIKAWDYIALLELKEMKKQLTPLIDANSDEEESKYFDLWIFNMELEEITGDKDYSKAIQKVTTICDALTDKFSIPEVASKKDFIKEVMENDFWVNVNLTKMEKVRNELRELIKFLGREVWTIIESNFQDSTIVKEGGSSPRPQFKNYKQRVIDYLCENSWKGAIYKVKNLIQLSNEDIKELEHILCDELGTKEDYDGISNKMSFGVFVRSIVGIDKEKIMSLMSEYQSQYNFNSRQQEFIHQIVDFVLENGDIVPDDLINTEPFKHQEYSDIFENTEPLYGFINLLHSSVYASASF